MVGWKHRLADSPRWVQLKEEADEAQIAVMVAARRMRPRDFILRHGADWRIQQVLDSIVSGVLKRDLAFSQTDLEVLVQGWLSQSSLTRYGGLPGGSIVGAVERLSSRDSLSAALRMRLIEVRKRALREHTSSGAAIARRIGRLLDGGGSQELPKGTFQSDFECWLSRMGQEEQAVWRALATDAIFISDRSTPPANQLKALERHIAKADVRQLSRSFVELLDRTTPNPALGDMSLDILKGLIFASSLLDHATLAGPLGRFADKCYRKVPQRGARSVRLANAAIWALSTMTNEPIAGAELFRLREKIKYLSARKQIDERLAKLAKRSDRTVEALEDESLPTLGLDTRSRCVVVFGDARAEVELTATEIAVSWFNGKGERLKSAPKEVREHHSDEFAALRQTLKTLEVTRASQALRFEQSWLEDRNWSLSDWTGHVLHHPIRRPLAEALIWTIDSQSGAVAIIPRAAGLEDAAGRSITPSSDARVRLWHPLTSDPQEVLAWRRRIIDLGLTQPIKQAHREVYVLTDAERQTRLYSNRFAAHILRQHQFRALCQARGWKYDFMGGWDSWNVPTRTLPRRDIAVSFHVDQVDNDARGDNGVSLHVATDQVRFSNALGQNEPLEAIPPVVFSELMRDVDLFVGVASVANDPTWSDGGPRGRHGGYWSEWAFGELGQSATTRRELMSWIAPKLSISDRLTITDRFLLVHGRRHDYAIHFGSGNIQIRPSNRYLCIVPDQPHREAGAVRLPFTGDGLVSIIISKAFLLAEDDKIKDLTILAQL
jgi:hypothetical protein